MIPFTPKHKRCPTCGQVVYGEIPDDPVESAVLHVLEHTNGRYVRTPIIVDMVGMDVHRQTIWRRLNALEKEGKVERHPDRPKSGWRKVRQKVDEMAA